MVSPHAWQNKDEMSVTAVSLQDPSRFQSRKWKYRSGNKDVHNGLSVVLGELQYYRLNCHLLLKECYY
jgi:hypothetical protein